MKDSLDEILDRCSEEEIEMLMKDFEFDKSESVLSERIYKKAVKKSGIARKNILGVIIASAACIAIAAVGITAGISMKNNSVVPVVDDGSSKTDERKPITEEIEYETALKYCQDNNVFIEGLSKDDVKQVYTNMNNSYFTEIYKKYQEEYSEKYNENVLQSSTEYDEKKKECDEFVEQFKEYYGKFISDFNEDILRQIFYTYYGIGLTQEKYKEIFEIRIYQGVKPFEERSIAGLSDGSETKLTVEKAKEIIAHNDDFESILEEFKKIQPYPDSQSTYYNNRNFRTYKPNKNETIDCDLGNYGFKTPDGYIGKVNIMYYKKDDDGNYIIQEQLYPKITQHSPDIVDISEPKKVGDTYQVTVTSEQKEPFLLTLEETINEKLHRKMVLVENGKCTFETQKNAVYKAVGYFSGRIELSETDARVSYKSFSDKIIDGQDYKDVSLRIRFDMEKVKYGSFSVCDVEYAGQKTTAITDLDFTVKNNKSEYFANITETFKIGKENKDFNVNVVPRYIFINPKYF